jgi:rSAM/selenodomain-associated transferase 1
MPRGCVVVMAKRPRPGTVKTRLAAELGDTTASLLYEAFLADTLAACAGTHAATMVAFTPPTEVGWFRRFAPGALLAAQPEGSFGDRLEAATAAGFAAGFGKVAVIGSDIPHLGCAAIEAGLAAAANGCAALAPTADGGYCLLALGAPQPSLFQDIDWSSGRELAQTIDRIGEAGLKLTLLPETFDIDTGRDLRRLVRALARGEVHCPRTAEVLAGSTVARDFEAAS